MEPTGIALGTTALVPLIFKTYEKCSDILRTARTLASELETVKGRLEIQRNLFHNEWLLVLSLVVDNVTANAMLNDIGHHKMWSSPVFEEMWKKEFGTSFDRHIMNIQETTGSLESILRTLPLVPSRRRELLAAVKWVTSKRGEVQQLLDTLRGQTIDMHYARQIHKEISELRKGKPAENSISRVAAFTPSHGEPFKRLRNVSKVLYDGLSSTEPCSCHTVHLQLDADDQVTCPRAIDQTAVPSTRQTGPSSIFHFVVTKSRLHSSSSQTASECTMLTIRSQRCQPPGAGNVAKKGVRFSMGEPHANLHPSPDILASAGPSPVEVTGDESEIRQIRNLCAVLEDPARPNPLGSIKPCQEAPSTSSYDYVVYSVPAATPLAVHRTSLQELFESPQKELFLTNEQRLRLALVLSFSLLNHGSYDASWFQRRWGSKDVVFFFPHQVSAQCHHSQVPGNNDDSCSAADLEPYLTPSFPSQGQGKAVERLDSGERDLLASRGRAKPPKSLARNERLYSLALVLVELATGRCFVRSSGDPYLEYTQAMDLIDSPAFKTFFGRRYALLVKKCFYCDFGLGDDFVGSEELQKNFYEGVVKELKTCLGYFGL